MSDDKQWVVWYLHWRYHSSRVHIDQEHSKAEAFSTASYLEDEADDCVNEVVGIEDPEGNFIDLAEYRAAKPEIARKRDEYWNTSREQEREAVKTRLTVAGPDGHEYTETWTDDYIEKYRDRWIGQFGADRLTVERLG